MGKLVGMMGNTLFFSSGERSFFSFLCSRKTCSFCYQLMRALEFWRKKSNGDLEEEE
jgi:hypothetical protein